MLFFIPLFFVVLWGCLEVGFVGSKMKFITSGYYGVKEEEF